MCTLLLIDPPLSLEPDEYVVLEKFDSTADDELNLLPGDIVTTVSIKMDGWWKIKRGSKVGYAPSAILMKKGIEEITRVGKSSVNNLIWLAHTHTHTHTHTCQSTLRVHFICL